MMGLLVVIGVALFLVILGAAVSEGKSRWEDGASGAVTTEWSTRSGMKAQADSSCCARNAGRELRTDGNPNSRHDSESKQKD